MATVPLMGAGAARNQLLLNAHTRGPDRQQPKFVGVAAAAARQRTESSHQGLGYGHRRQLVATSEVK
ncbi:hypothetical protein M5D96_012546 [Drosophila gunungcola]|uniref:Uncharacterized protein n=1 Tax=Drosophila gunungcola TaxID=103775 RepID=A0A9P9YDC4_9MUSC|nr:hypothetical protein M5D96_012546 [Drosophila gunungcola]